jgi:ABC-type transporter Mla subunit MlaD
MAELVGFTSSIATLAAAVFHVARNISTIADDLGTASAQIKSIAVDTKAVAIILRDIEAKLMSGQDSSRRLSEDTKDVLVEVLELCRYEIEDLDRNLAPLREDGRRADAADLKQKAKWLFDKPKIAARQASLDSLKLTLSLMLHNVQLFDGQGLQ